MSSPASLALGLRPRLAGVLAAAVEVAALAGDSTSQLQVVVPPSLAVGFYRVAVRLVRPTETEPRISNQLGLIVGPLITAALSLTVPRDGSGRATITLGCAPDVRAGQSVSLLLGSREVLPESWSGPADSFTFILEQAPVGDHLARLRVDGIDSPLIDRAAEPPVFFNYRVTIT